MSTRKRPRRVAEAASPLQAIVTAALDDMKAVNVKVLDVRTLTSVADTFVIASGNSDRHVRSIAERVLQKAKEAGVRTRGTEGGRDGEWVLVDLSDVIVHIMLPRAREFYGLERLWDSPDMAPAIAALVAPRKAVPRKVAATDAPARARARTARAKSAGKRASASASRRSPRRPRQH